MGEPGSPLPWPESLCHSCGAPPRYVQTGRALFVLCPLLPQKYPPQPVLRCHAWRPRGGEHGIGGEAGDGGEAGGGEAERDPSSGSGGAGYSTP